MCGICGLLNLAGEDTITETALRQMMSAQQHRGPDDDGCHCEPGMGLGFRRLAILDLTPTGHQPMCNEDETVWLSFNGEIYNFQDVVPTLEQAGHRFRSRRSDSEMIVHAYEQWGPDCVQRFIGMFAFAIWDRRKRSIFIARDRMGEKPLYYWSDGTHFAFSSEVKALLTLPMIPRQLNLRALQSYLSYEYVPAPESIFTGIQKLPAGHYLEIHLDGSDQGRQTADWRPHQYWDVRFQTSETPGRSVDDYAHELRELLRQAVKRCLISDVPLGLFLSGGLDSSSLLALATEVSTQQPKTFSIGFEEKTFSELDYAQIVAHHFDSEHHVEILKPEANDLIQTVANFLDEPFADASALPTYLVSRMARQHVTVALSGDAGDELFAGYDWYRAQKFASSTIDHLPGAMRHQLSTLATRIPPSAQKKGLRNVTRRFLEVATLPPALQHSRWQAFWRDDALDQLLTIPEDERIPAIDPRILTILANSGSDDPLDQQQYLDLKRYLPDDILFKVDRMSMAVSLETRGPLMDYTLVEFAARIPPSLRLHGLTTKYLFRRAMGDILPEKILGRRKLGFNIPYKNWLRNELSDLLRDSLSPQRLREQGIFQPQYVQTMIDEHLSGVRDHAHKLWQLLIFQLWSDRYLTGITAHSDLLETGSTSH
ncbi:MAG TPA: asparagine synthase (glutamine-hydrolyzing) [Ktedonosporobacter sp.]|nr:asparagine synthase (glutamine-hydrolyzing) [Ktedonosporobacter sp.]